MMINFAVIAHATDETKFCIRIKEGQFKNTVFSFGKISVDKEVEPPALSIDYNIECFPDIEDFQQKLENEFKDEFNAIVISIFQKIHDEFAAKKSK